MTDKLETQLAAGIEDEIGLTAMAAKLAPRPDPARPPQLDQFERTTPIRQHATGSVESKLQQIERLVSEIRTISSVIKGQLG